MTRGRLLFPLFMVALVDAVSRVLLLCALLVHVFLLSLYCFSVGVLLCVSLMSQSRESIQTKMRGLCGNF